MCMLRSFSIALKDVFNDEFPLESITKSLRRELVTNHGFYQQFSIDNIDALVELEKFLDNPLGYNKEDTSDLFLLALGNTFKVNVIVFQSHTCFSQTQKDVSLLIQAKILLIYHHYILGGHCQLTLNP